METETIEQFCKRVYDESFVACSGMFRAQHSSAKKSEVERYAQLEAIKNCEILAMQKFPTREPAAIWKVISACHVLHKSGIPNFETLRKAKSASQSWIKSSGHAFEAMIKQLGTLALSGEGITVVLQRDLSALVANNTLANAKQDYDWLKIQLEGGIFDLYTLIDTPTGKKCFGCIQCKTSIRDRVSRDREPSVHAMNANFWSIAFVLDGAFFTKKKSSKFVAMVNGGSAEFPTNGWHGCYVFSDKYQQDRIYATDITMKNFKEHAKSAAKKWLEERSWLRQDWRADKE